MLNSITVGLRESRFGIVVLSPSFFDKHWPQRELDGLAQREEGGEKVILPVWKDVTVQDVRARSPLLADRIAARWSDGLPAVVDDILRVVRAGAIQKDASKEDRIFHAVLRIKRDTRFLWQELRNHVNDNSAFSAWIRGDTLKKIEADLATLRDHAGLRYQLKYVSYDMQLGTEVNEITVTRTGPILTRAIARALAFDESD